MKRFTLFLYPLFLCLGLSLCATQSGFAQFRGTGQSGFGSNSTTNSRSYYTRGMIGEAIIEADHDTRSIIVITDDETNEHIQEIIKNLDRPVPQVLIKVVFLEVTYNDDLDFGIEGAINASKKGQDGGLFETLFGIAAETRGGFYKVLEDDIQVTLRAIAEKGKVEVLSRPSVLTRNNQEAVINVGQRVPFVTNVRISDTGLQTNTVEYEEIGIILRVTPFITQEGLVEMILAPEISSLTDSTIQVSDTINSPIITNRSADTVVVTPNGRTVVIGGMMEDITEETIKKFPILGDIPLLGMAFRRTIKNKSKTELMIFLTPHVVEGPNPLLEMSKSEQSKSELIPQAFSEEQLNKYLGEQPIHATLESDSTGTAPIETNAANADGVKPKEETTPSEQPKTNSGFNSRKRSSKGIPIR